MKLSLVDVFILLLLRAAEHFFFAIVFTVFLLMARVGERGREKKTLDSSLCALSEQKGKNSSSLKARG